MIGFLAMRLIVLCSTLIRSVCLSEMFWYKHIFLIKGKFLNDWNTNMQVRDNLILCITTLYKSKSVPNNTSFV